MPSRALRRDPETPVRATLAELNGRQPDQARIIRQARGASRRPAQMQAVQRRPAACLKVRLIPHGLNLGQTIMPGKDALPRRAGQSSIQLLT